MSKSNNYEIALAKANKAAHSVSCSLITQQIVRDNLFGKYANDGKYVSAPFIWGFPIISIFKFLFAREIKICRENLITSGFNVTNQVNFRTTINPLSILRILMTLKYVYYRQMHNAKIKRREKCLSKVDVDEKQIVKILYVNFFCAKIIKNHNFNFYYFSLGCPQYLRYFTQKAHEIQHGIVHANHPLANPIARSRGCFFSDKRYVTGCKVLHPKVNYAKFRNQYLEREVISTESCVYIEGWPPSSEIVERHLNSTFSNYVVLRHPNNEPIFRKINVSKRRRLIQSASSIYVGLTTLLIELSQDQRVTVVVTHFDLDRHKLAADKKSVQDFIYQRYGVTINEILFVV